MSELPELPQSSWPEPQYIDGYGCPYSEANMRAYGAACVEAARRTSPEREALAELVRLNYDVPDRAFGYQEMQKAAWANARRVLEGKS